MNGRLIASFLTDEEQTRYEQMLLPLDLDEKARRSLYINQNGSNLWKVLLLNQNGIRTPSLQELDLIARNSPDFLKGCIVDAPAIVLRSNACSDKDRSYFAKQVSGLIGRTSFPHAVVVEGLNVKVDKSSAYSLSFCVSDKLKVIEAPAFDCVNHGRTFQRINPDYTLDFDDKSPRKVYTGYHSISRLCLGATLDLETWVDLTFSYGRGQIVTVHQTQSTQKI